MFTFIERLTKKHKKLYYQACDYMNKKKFTEAIKCLDHAIKIDPEYYPSYLLRGEVHYCFYGLSEIDYKHKYKDKKGYQSFCLDNATSDFLRFLKMFPSHAYGCLLLGMVYEAKKDYHNALEYYETANIGKNQLKEPIRKSLLEYLERVKGKISDSDK